MMPGLAVAAKPATVLVLGDSLSAAHNIAADSGWVHLLDQRLAVRAPAMTVINASISGETTQSGRVRLPEILSSSKPAIVIIELGANDGLRGLPLDEIRSNLEAMIEASCKTGASVLLLGIELPVNYGPRYRDSLRSIYADLAQRHQVTLLPFLLEGVALDASLMQPDGLHPNADGQVRVFDNVWQKLQPMLP